ncbi:MAG: DUF1015 family protein [Geobacteraceae bacterium]
MAIIRPFRALRPPGELSANVAAPPYDVMSVKEASAMAADNPYSFLHISRPEIDLPVEIDVHSEPVYRKGRENLDRFIREGLLKQDRQACYYLYRQRMGDISQTGLVVCAGVDDYQNNVIRKHEHTRPDKEEDRLRHIDQLDANDEPVFCAYRHDPAVEALMADIVRDRSVYDFTSDDGVTHILWLIDDLERIDRLTALFAAVPTLYVADGHHRSAAASRVRDMRKARNPRHTGQEEYNYFLTVIFPDNEMNIMPYNRVVRDLDQLSLIEFMARVEEKFDITPISASFQPAQRHQFGMFLAGRWYRLMAKEGTFRESDIVGRLDVSILQDNLLNPVLKIHNPRTDQRIQFVGGIRGIDELERLVRGGEYQVAFNLYPTSMEELMALADMNKIMPPKSTWFEPKLRSGLFVHLLS